MCQPSAGLYTLQQLSLEFFFTSYVLVAQLSQTKGCSGLILLISIRSFVNLSSNLCNELKLTSKFVLQSCPGFLLLN
ncbi:unnamed protein product [Schistosoma intercalatum]|nr:unnamed protein product [Schistosoma intercalatum]CAH8597094.1 unnamed protein product [Schistosoma intercalatum]